MLWPVLSDASVLRDCVNLEVSVPRGVPVRWETSSLGLETLFFRGKKSRRHVQKYATLLLITEEISYLDWWKYANSTLIATSHYVPFNVRQSGTFAPSETGKVIPQEKKKEPLVQASVSAAEKERFETKRPVFAVIHERLLQVFISLQRPPSRLGKSVERKLNYDICLICLRIEKNERSEILNGFHQESLGKILKKNFDDAYKAYMSSTNLSRVSASDRRNYFIFSSCCCTTGIRVEYNNNTWNWRGIWRVFHQHLRKGLHYIKWTRHRI